MIGNKAINWCVTNGQRTSCTNLFRGILTDRAGIAPPELAFLLGFVALVAATGFVFMEDKLTDGFTSVSERVEMASVNMPNPLGGGGGANIVVASNDVVGNGGGNGNGNGNGNSNGNSGKNK